MHIFEAHGLIGEARVIHEAIITLDGFEIHWNVGEVGFGEDLWNVLETLQCSRFLTAYLIAQQGEDYVVLGQRRHLGP